MICEICGEDKLPYHFVIIDSSNEDKTFFVSAYRNDKNQPVKDVCWECNGPYKCLQCGQVKPAGEYRVGGRYCKVCKSTWRVKPRR